MLAPRLGRGLDQALVLLQRRPEVALLLEEPRELKAARDALADEMGVAALVDAAAVASNFERMVRIADGTGIELGEALEEFSEDVREELGLRPSHD